jgi:hypothetical protein
LKPGFEAVGSVAVLIGAAFAPYMLHDDQILLSPDDMAGERLGDGALKPLALRQ